MSTYYHQIFDLGHSFPQILTSSYLLLSFCSQKNRRIAYENILDSRAKDLLSEAIADSELASKNFENSIRESEKDFDILDLEIKRVLGGKRPMEDFHENHLSKKIVCQLLAKYMYEYCSI